MPRAPKPRLRRDLLADLSTDEHRSVQAGTLTNIATCILCTTPLCGPTLTCGFTYTCGCTHLSITCDGC